ncbi:sensor histidine kinase [Cohnella hongkongensis]|uniref:histidine kinase n=1 Tax=Cohnella hongkongensis TaxID=178337 RepID=A0ABV9F946_9BACL
MALTATRGANAEGRIKRYIPFTYKTMIPYLILVLLTDIVIGSISYTMLIDSRTEMAETNLRTAMEQARENMEYQMDEIQRMSDTLFGSLPFQRALQTRGDPLNIYLTMLDEIVPQIQSPLQLYGNDIRLILYVTNEELNYVLGDDLSEPIDGDDYYILPFSEIENSEWFQSYRETGRDNGWLQIDTDARLENLSHIRKLVSYSDYSTVIGYVRITAKLPDLLGSFDALPVEEGIALRLRDMSSDSVLFERGTADRSGTGYLSLREEIPESSLAIEAFVPSSYLTKDASRLREAIVAVCLLSFVVMTGIGLVVARLSGRKMRRIVALVRSFEEGNFRKRIRFSGNDEFVRIADSFNVMAGSIQELINSVYVEGMQKKQAELEALQAQINPHFLFNTLSTISSLANLGETRKATEMIQRLSRFYRLTLNKGQVFIALEKELEQIQTYLDIQRVKYADAFTVHVDVDPEIMNVKVIKLIFQPFVENIFKHAWFGEAITIRIAGHRAGDRIELKVIDDGVGMPPEQVRTIMQGAGHGGGYGVRNVDERIKLRYGKEYGVRIGSVRGAGTTVLIVLPASGEPSADAE